jgi:GT2 family glycosyltransferase
VIYFLTVNYYSTNLVTKLINSIQASKNISHQTVIVNNSPEDNSIHLLSLESVLIIESGSNLGFGSACNLGLNWIYAQDSQAIVWLINPDTYIVELVLDKVDLFFKTHSQLSIVGTVIYTPNNEVWFAGGKFIPATGAILNQDFSINSNTEYSFCDWVSACSLLINLRKFSECPQFDPAYFLYYEDFDFCRRYANQGHLITVTKQLSVIHQPSSITNKNIFKKIQHSTYSYLITLERYTTKLILSIRLTRLITYAFILIFVKPKVAFGKLYGVLLYLRRSLPFCHKF